MYGEGHSSREALAGEGVRRDALGRGCCQPPLGRLPFPPWRSVLQPEPTLPPEEAVSPP
jgi:hypothetical protein